MADKNLEIAVDILKFSGQLCQSWITRFFVVQGGLGAAVGTVVAWSPKGVSGVVLPALILICGVGVVASIVLALTTVRALRWHAGHVQRVKALQDADRPLFVEKMAQGGLRIIPAMIFIGWLGAFAWLALGFAFYGMR